MNLRENQSVLEFVREAEKLRALLETEPEEVQTWIASVLSTLASLYASGLKLPNVECGEEEELVLPKEFKVTSEEVGAIFNRVKRIFGKHDLFHDVFDPTSPQDHEVIGGTLSDGLSDIHSDIIPGLRAWSTNHDEGLARLVVYDWRESLRWHWGRHATEALRALHFLVEDVIEPTE